MKKYTIFGNPVEHSKSPQMHNAGFDFLKFNGYYDKTLLKDGNNIKKVFLENNFYGANITVPHKEYAFTNADEVIGLASKIKAVNTYIKKDNKILAYNTDAPGFIKAIEEFEPIKKALILGAGGTARAISVALYDKGVDTTVLNRSVSKRDFFIDLGVKFYDWDGMRLQFLADLPSYDIIINSTSAGLKDEQYPAPMELLNPLIKNSKYAIDCIYGKETPFLSLAKKNKIISKDGEDMLLYQGVLAFELFTGVKADDSLVEAMRRGLKKT